jgi:hypothetical protein
VPQANSDDRASRHHIQTSSSSESAASTIGSSGETLTEGTSRSNGNRTGRSQCQLEVASAWWCEMAPGWWAVSFSSLQRSRTIDLAGVAVQVDLVGERELGDPRFC